MVRVDISLRTIVLVLTAIAAVWLLVRLWAIALVVIVALILVGTVNPLVVRLERRGVRRGWAVLLVFVAVLLVGSLLLLVTLPPLFDQLLQWIEAAPAQRDRLIAWLEHRELTAPLAQMLRDARSEELFASVGTGLLAYSGRALEIVGYGATAVMLALYIVADGKRSQRGLFAVVPRSYHVRLARILIELEVIVGGYVRGQLITSAAITLFTLALLTICGVPNALPLAVFAGLTDVIPFVGGLLATAPAVLGALGQGWTVTTIILVTMMVYQEFESRILVPRIYGRVLRLSAATVILALLVGGTLLGILGALLALPISAGLLMIARELRVELPGDDSADLAGRARVELLERTYEQRSAGAAPEQAAVIAAAVARASREAESVEPALAADVRVGDREPQLHGRPTVPPPR